MNQENETIDNKHSITSEVDTLNYGKTNSVEKNESDKADDNNS
jgi:hypothetical protein